MIALGTIEQLLKPVIEDMGLLLWGCEYSVGKRTALLRVYIDRADANIDIDDCVSVSRQINALLDVEAGIDGHYHLEVSSPGLNRPLFKEAHYLMSVGKDIKLTLYDPIDGRRNFAGRLLSAANEEITLSISGAGENNDEAQEQSRVFLLRDIKKAKLMYSFSVPAGKKLKN